jgi:LmbE family N-acetylglucosaminyl deacetylase
MRRLLVASTAVVLVLAALPAGASRDAAPMADLDVLFIGAHPDDEAGGLSTYGQWAEYDNVRTGVITITRGEGGGNAVGTEEGAALGLLREAEERRAVGKAGVGNIYNLDFVDYWFNLSAPLTEEVWDREALLERIVRVVRMTRPQVIITMSPGINHGHHQLAAWLAVEAFRDAADPDRFAHQLDAEGLDVWRAGKLFTTRALGQGATGPNCAAAFAAAEPTDIVNGVWSGRASDQHGTTWAAVERVAQREYASQGWHVFPDVPTDPAQLGCDYFTLIDSRVPFTADAVDPLEGAVTPAAGGLPLGSELFLTTDRFRVTAGAQADVTVRARNGGRRTLRDAEVMLAAPAGWSATGDGRLGSLRPGREGVASFTLTAPADAQPGRIQLTAELRAGGRASAGEGERQRAGGRGSAGVTGTTARALEVVPAVQGLAQFHPDVVRFREWTVQTGVEQVDTLIVPQVPIAQGSTQALRVDVTNFSDQEQSGTVTIGLPDGFDVAENTVAYDGLAPGGQDSVTFTVTNTDTELPTANEGGEYAFTVQTTSADGTSETAGALNLAPATTVPGVAQAPVLDGVEQPGEYPGDTLDVGRLWEGQTPDSAADASGTAKLAWHDDALYVLVHVVDDTLGTVVPPDDAKRHWRTDSVEITVDPRGNARDTSATYKLGAFPVTDGGGPAGYRDADAHQGPIADTAPGTELAATLSEPYQGYTLETRIDLADLPAAVDPEQMGLNLLIYDSDTQDLTGQTRLGWSTWGGVQASPYRWGRAVLDGYVPPDDRPTEPGEPVIPLEVARSVASPQSILQSSQDGVPLGGGPAAQPAHRARFDGRPALKGNTLEIPLRAGASGTAHVFAWAGQTVASDVVHLDRGRTTLRWQLDAAARDALAAGGTVLVGWEATAGGTTSLAKPVHVTRR